MKYIVLVILFITCNHEIFGCRCSSLLVDENIEIAEYIFSGKAISKYEAKSDSCHSTYTVAFAVLDVWKGNIIDTVEVETNWYGKACGSRFSIGGNYLVYAYTTQCQAIKTTRCWRTSRLELTLDVDYLNSKFNKQEYSNKLTKLDSKTVINCYNNLYKDSIPSDADAIFLYNKSTNFNKLELINNFIYLVHYTHHYEINNKHIFVLARSLNRPRESWVIRKLKE